jgi:hypothetical protein
VQEKQSAVEFPDEAVTRQWMTCVSESFYCLEGLMAASKIRENQRLRLERAISRQFLEVA